MVVPLKNFLKTDMEELSSLRGMTKLSEDEMEASLSKHSKLSKRDSDKKKLEVNQEVTDPVCLPVELLAISAFISIVITSRNLSNLIYLNEGPDTDKPSTAGSHQMYLPPASNIQLVPFHNMCR